MFWSKSVLALGPNEAPGEGWGERSGEGYTLLAEKHPIMHAFSLMAGDDEVLAPSHTDLLFQPNSDLQTRLGCVGKSWVDLIQSDGLPKCVAPTVESYAVTG